MAKFDMTGHGWFVGLSDQEMRAKMAESLTQEEKHFIYEHMENLAKEAAEHYQNTFVSSMKELMLKRYQKCTLIADKLWAQNIDRLFGK